MKNKGNISHPGSATFSVAPSGRDASDEDGLADKLPARLLAPYLLVAVALAMGYGSSFLLVDLLRSTGRDGSGAGSVVSVGIFATLVGSLGAGRIAERTGLLTVVAMSAAVMAGAMACFALTGPGGLPFAYAGGVLLGFGWALFYTLAPIQLIDCLKPEARLEALTLLSGSKMLGIGVAAPLGHLLSAHFGGPAAAYACYGVCATVAAAFVRSISPAMDRHARRSTRAVALSLSAALPILRTRTVIPVLAIGVAACTFAGLSTFQELYGRSRGLAPDTFFLTFTATTVVLRFSIAPLVRRLPLGRFSAALFLATFCGIVLLALNRDSVAAYVAGTLLFATGYGLTYSALNAMVVNLAEERALSVPIASQVFTVGYFVGLFGFPSVAGGLVALHGVDAVLWAMAAMAILNVAVVAPLIERPRLRPPASGSEA